MLVLCSACGGGGSSSELHDASNGRGVSGCTGEDGPHEGVSAPVGVGDALAAAEVQHLKPKVSEPLICLLQGVVGVVGKELHQHSGDEKGRCGGGEGEGEGEGGQVSWRREGSL